MKQRVNIEKQDAKVWGKLGEKNQGWAGTRGEWGEKWQHTLNLLKSKENFLKE